MVRARSGVARLKKKKRLLERAKGFHGARKNMMRLTQETVKRADAYAFAGRKQKKRDYRKLWIVRINAAARSEGLSYSQLIHGLNQANIQLNRKQLSEMAINEPESFKYIVEKAKAALS